MLTGAQNTNGLFTVDSNVSEKLIGKETALLASDELITWHRKLGHLGVQNMKKLKNMSEGLKFPDSIPVKCVLNLSMLGVRLVDIFQ